MARQLIDGDFVTVLLEGVQPIMALGIPRKAVLSDQQGNYVYVVGEDKKVEQRRIQMGQSTPSTAVISAGLKEGELVVVDGIQRVRPGIEVSPAGSPPPPSPIPAPRCERALMSGVIKRDTARIVRLLQFTRRAAVHVPAPASMISGVFIDRPRLAVVVAVLLTLAGGLAMLRLPVSQFPDIVPPQVTVSATFTGASAAVVEATVAQPIEAAVVGVDKMIYMKSNSANDGSYSLTVSFELGTNPDINTVNVNNRVQQALARLPNEVQRAGSRYARNPRRSWSSCSSIPTAANTTRCSSATTSPSTCWTGCCARRASAMRRCSAGSTIRCASGSTSTGSPR